MHTENSLSSGDTSLLNIAEHWTGTRCRWKCLRATKELVLYRCESARVSLTSFASSRWCVSRDGWRTQSPQNKTDQRGASNPFICTQAADVSILKTYSLYYHDVRFLNNIWLCMYFVLYAFCTFFLQLSERASLMRRLGCHTFYHINMWHGFFWAGSHTNVLEEDLERRSWFTLTAWRISLC